MRRLNRALLGTLLVFAIPLVARGVSGGTAEILGRRQFMIFTSKARWGSL